MFMQVSTGLATADPTSIRVAGWSESWYDDTIIVDNLLRDFNRLCSKRAALLPNTGVIVAQRFQQVDPVGPARLQLSRFPGTQSECDYPSLALLCRVAGSGVRNSRPMYLRGIPDEMITRGEFSPTFNYGAAVQRFFTELEGYRFRAQSLSAVEVPVLTILDTGEVHTAAPGLAGVAAGSRVQVSRCQKADKTTVSGRFFVASRASDTIFTLANWTAGEVTGGSVRIYETIFPLVPADGVTSGRIVTRKVGRPFGQFRGRQSPRK